MYLHTLNDWMNSGFNHEDVAFRRAYVCRLDDIQCRFDSRLHGSRKRKNRLAKLKRELITMLIEGYEMDRETARHCGLSW